MLCGAIFDRCLQYGKVKEVRMALDNKGQPKGFAFVEFEQEVRVSVERSGALVYAAITERCSGVTGRE